MMDARNHVTEFSLAPGGPVDRLQAKLRLRHRENLRIGLRALFTALALWLPLAVMALIHANADAGISFFHDIGAHVRFLVIVPLLIVAEGPIGGCSRAVVAQFLSSGLVADADAAGFEAAVKRGRRLIDTWAAELIVMALGVLLVWIAIRGVFAEPATFWFERPTPQGSTLTPAGWWYAAVATPLFVYLLLRWLWRYLVWWWFLARVARLDLRLTGAHPDRVGGLGFVGYHQSVFAILSFAVASGVSAAAANRILYAGATLEGYRTPLVAVTLGAVILGVAPMLVFSPRLVRAKQLSWMSYSRFSSDYVWLFERKWLAGNQTREEALGSGDIQSLADLGGSFERMVQMRPLVVDRRLVLSFLVAAAAPALPLLLTVMPLRDILRTLLKAFV
jgi:hypothetical protein